MISFDEDALICDLAETYQIYDYRQLPVLKVAVFAVGLRDDSRIKMKISGHLVSMDTLLLSGISDKLTTLVWFQTEDGQKGKNRPTMITEELTNNKKENKEDAIVFSSGKDFIRARRELLGVGGE